MKRTVIVILMLVGVLLLGSCGFKEAAVEEPVVEFSFSETQLQSMCKLATLRCFVNNVAKTKLEGNFIQRDSTLWIEYSGTVDIGIDFSKVTLEVDGDKLIITMPDAEVLSVNDPELTEDSYFLSEQGILSAKITAEDEKTALQTAQENMKTTVNESTQLLATAKARAQILIENYIHQMDKLAGTSHEIIWKTIG